MEEALGLNARLRARLPDLNKSPDPVVVGKWYCPFIFIGDGDVGSQMSNSPYYKMTLQQNWEEIFGCGNLGEGWSLMFVLRGKWLAEGRDVGDGVVWFGSSGVGLSLAIVGRVEWEEERRGFEWRGENEVRVKRGEEYGGVVEWRRFGCYVLVKTFGLRRMDGTLVLTWEFRHTHHIRTKWERENAL